MRIKLLIALAALSAFVACNQDYTELPESVAGGSQQPIEIVASTAVSRAELVTSATQMQSMGIYCAHTKELGWQEYFSGGDVQLKMDNQQLSYSQAESQWLYEGSAPEWGYDSLGDNYTFFGYSPFGSSDNGIVPSINSDGELSIAYTMPSEALLQPDLLIASPLIDTQPTISGSVSLHFYHALAAVAFSCSTSGGLTITKISISGICDSGVVSFGESIKWDLLQQSSDGVPYEAIIQSEVDSAAQSSEVKTSNDGYLMVIPQTLDATAIATVSLLDSTGEEYEQNYSLETEVWEAGNIYTYVVECGQSLFYRQDPGTIERPFLIESIFDLETLCDVVNNNRSITILGESAPSDCEGFGGYYFAMSGDIELDSDGSYLHTAIGNSTYPFKGIFDGGGFSIVNLTVDSSESYQGFFGYVCDARISNLSVSGSVSGDQYVGGVVGFMTARSAEVDAGSSVENCSNFASVTSISSATQSHVGGVVGSMGSFSTNRVSSCCNSGEVRGSLMCVGGVIGRAFGTVESCYNLSSGVRGEQSSANYTGGVVGHLESGSITNSYNKGNVYSEANFCGGMVGYINNATISDCYNMGSVNSSAHYVAGVVGYLLSSKSLVEQCYNLGSISGAWFVGGVVGSSYEGSISSCYNGAEVSGSNNYVGGVIGHMERIACTITACYNYASVSGSQWCGGIVGVAKGAIEGCYNLSQGSVEGSDSYAAGIAGYLSQGTISGCYNCATITGSASVGGLVGYAGVGILSDSASLTSGDCIVENCYNTGSVSATSSNDPSTQDVAGGLIGSINVGTIANCYNVGSVKSNSNNIRGGVIGLALNNQYSCSSCYYLNSSCIDNSMGESLRRKLMQDSRFVELLNDYKSLIAGSFCRWRQDDSGEVNDYYPYFEVMAEP